MDKIEEAFKNLGRTEKARFISQNIEYANAVAVSHYVKGYLFDVLQDVGDDNYVAMLLRNKGYKVTKKANHLKHKYMRTFRIIQGIAASVGMLMAVSLADGMDATGKEIDASVVLLVLSGVILFEVLTNKDKKEAVK